MKNIIGFNWVTIFKCEDCGCLFTVDSFKEDLKTWNINCQKISYAECPNCKNMCTKIKNICIYK